MTIKRFYESPYEKVFSASITGCTSLPDGKWAVTLDETLFYPEGGGQPGDTGMLAAAHVLDTREKDGALIHITDTELPVGASVQGSIDWTERFSRMQHHSGEHIVSGLIHMLYGYDNVGFHMGHDAVTLDLSGELTPEMLAEVELRANQIVWKNIPVSAEYPSASVLENLQYRSKKELSGAVRIVTVPDCDLCACCGLHVAYTGEIGIVKLVTAQRYKGGTRIWMLCGDRALQDAVQKNNDIYTISGLLSAKPAEVSQAVKRLQEESDKQKAEISSLQGRLFTALAAQIPQGTFTLQWMENLTPAELRRYALALCERCTVAAVLSQKDDVWEYAIASHSIDVRGTGKELNSTFQGRGGGKSGLVQGSVRGKRSDLDLFFESIFS